MVVSRFLLLLIPGNLTAVITWYVPMRKFAFLLLLVIARLGIPLFAGTGPELADRDLVKKMEKAATAFLNSLSREQSQTAVLAFGDTARYDWNFTPRERKGVTLKTMTDTQRKYAFQLLEIMLSERGYANSLKIIDLENLLRVIESRPPNDVFRDPENYAFLFFGKPGPAAWGWRMEGHHLSLHFSCINGQISFTPGFMGSNPGEVISEVPQKGLRILNQEEDHGFALLDALQGTRREKAIIGSKSPREILSGNAPRIVNFKDPEGISYREMDPEQQNLFLQLIRVYLDRYHVTLKNQQMDALKKVGLDKIYFAWMGDVKPLRGPGQGHYYRIHGPTLLIEYDNTQNGANHIHSVVRDLTNDFGEDLLRMHYKKMHTSQN